MPDESVDVAIVPALTREHIGEFQLKVGFQRWWSGTGHTRWCRSRQAQVSASRTRSEIDTTEVYSTR